MSTTHRGADAPIPPDDRFSRGQGNAEREFEEIPAPPPLNPAPVEPPTDILIEAVTASLATLPRPALGSLVRTLSVWMNLAPERRALLLKLLDPELTDGVVASVCGVGRHRVYDWREYMRLKKLLVQPSSVISGVVDADGGIEAWFYPSE